MKRTRAPPTYTNMSLGTQESVPRPALAVLLDRPDRERLREFRYRFAQALVFGLPVIALQRWGPALGGREADRWVGVLQALLAGWVVYVAAAGMLFEALLILRRRFSVDLLPALIAVICYVLGLVQLGATLLRSTPHPHPHPRPAFASAVILLISWSALRWAWLAHRTRAA